MSKYYLAYGSNLNLYQMHKRCKRASIIGTTILNNYHLIYKGVSDNEAFLTIEPKEDSFVPLGIFKISYFDELSLDKYEIYPYLYYKTYLPIFINNKIERGLIYIMQDEFNYYLPNLKYVSTCIQGYNNFNFDLEILNKALDDTKNKIKYK